MIVVNEEICCLDVLSPFGARNVAVLSQGKCAHVVLKNDVISNSETLCFEEIPCPEDIARLVHGDSVTLCFKKIPCPEDIARPIMKTDDFILSGTFGRYFVLGRRACYCTLAKCENGSRMSFVIIMGLMGCINVPVESCERVLKKCEVQFASGIEIFEKFSSICPNRLCQVV